MDLRVGSRDGSKPNILVLTSMQDNQLYKELYELGATKVATKPIAMKALESLIRELVGDNNAAATV